MSTQFVDDGVCDCCDGTDELEGCANTCIEKNAAVREGLQKQVDDYKAALAKRKEYAAGAAAARQRMRERLGAVDADIAGAEKEVEKLLGDKAKLEETADARRAAREEKRKAEAAERAERERAEAERRAKEEAEAAAKAGAEAETAAAAAAAAGDGEQPAAAQEGEHEETAEERGRRIAAQWTNDPEAAGAAADADGKQSEAGAAADAASKPAAAAGAAAGKAGGSGAGGGKAAGGSWLSSTWSKLKASLGGQKGAADADADADKDWDKATCEEPTCYDSEAPAAAADGDGVDIDAAAAEGGAEGGEGAADSDPEMDAANAAVAAAEERVSSLRAEKELLARQVGYDYGADDAWLALASHCSEAREPQYSYRLCLFDKAAQVDNNAGHETSLGRWRGFEKGYTEGVFDNGDWCHQAPARSMRVTFQCGLEEAAWGASEPSTCTYAATMATPAACKEDDLKALEARLAELLQEERALAEEIAAEEAERKAALAKRRAAQAAAKDEL